MANLIDHVMKACRQNWRAIPVALQRRMVPQNAVETTFSARKHSTCESRAPKTSTVLAVVALVVGVSIWLVALLLSDDTVWSVKWAIFKIAKNSWNVGFYQFGAGFDGFYSLLQYFTGGIRLWWYVSCKSNFMMIGFGRNSSVCDGLWKILAWKFKSNSFVHFDGFFSLRFL